jgi:hypothetical protein
MWKWYDTVDVRGVDKSCKMHGVPFHAEPSSIVINPLGDTRSQGGHFSFSTFGKTMPLLGNILATLRSYSGIE